MFPAVWLPQVIVALLASQLLISDEGRQRGLASLDQQLFELNVEHVADLGTSEFRHPGQVNAALICRHGRVVATAGGSLIRIWDARTGKQLRSIRETEKKSIYSIACSDNGRLVSGSLDGSICLWDIDSAQLLRRFPKDRESLFRVAISSDGKIVAASGSSANVYCFDADTGKKLLEFKSHLQDGTAGSKQITKLIFATKGSLIASVAGSSEILCWDGHSGQLKHRLKNPQAKVTAISFSQDAKYLVSADSSDNVRLWDVEKGKVVSLFQKPGHPVDSVVFADSLGLILGGGAGNLTLWNQKTGRVQRALASAETGVSALSLSANQKIAVSWGDNSTVARVWDLQEARENLLFEGHRTAIVCLRSARAGKTLASLSSDGQFCLWDMSGKKVNVERIRAASLPLSPFYIDPEGDEIFVVDRDGGVTICQTDKLRVCAKKHLVRNRSLIAVTFSHEGRIAATADTEGRIQIWALPSWKLMKTLSESRVVINSMRFSPDGQVLAVGGTNSEFDPAKETRESTVRLWNVSSGQILGELGPHTSYLTILSFSPDGRMLATAGFKDKQVKVWEVVTRKQRFCWQVERPGLLSCVFSPNGRWAALTGRGMERNVVIQSTENGQTLWESRPMWEPVCLALSRQSRVLGVGLLDGNVAIWKLKETTRPVRAGQKRPTSQELRLLRESLASEDAQKAHLAIQRFVRLSDRALPCLRKCIHPVQLDANKRKRIQQLIRDLSSNRFATRAAATQALKEMGRLAKPQLEDSLRGTISPETEQRITMLLTLLKNRRLSREELFYLRSIEVLERIGTEDAMKELRRLANGDSGFLETKEALASVVRLKNNRSR